MTQVEATIVVPLPFPADDIAKIVEPWYDIQKLRIATSNRIFAIEFVKVKGKIVPTGDKAPAILHHAKEQQLLLEQAFSKEIERVWRPHPLAPWAAEVKGLGKHSIAVIISLLGGDPYIAVPKWWEDNPDFDPDIPSSEDNRKRNLILGDPYIRTVAQLRAYCGYGDPALRRERGMKQEDALAMGNPRLKPRMRLLVESFIKAQPNVYSDLYYEIKQERYTDRTHEKKCAQCRANVGDPWRAGHSDAAAKRFVIKAFLKDLWYAAKEIHE